MQALLSARHSDREITRTVLLFLLISLSEAGPHYVVQTCPNLMAGTCHEPPCVTLSATGSHKNLPNYLPSGAWAKVPVNYGKVRVKQGESWVVVLTA